MVPYDEMSVEERTSLIDGLLVARRTARKFKMDPAPPREVVEEVIWAGFQAPSSVKAMLGLEKDWRRVVAIRNDSPVMAKINRLVIEEFLSSWPEFLDRMAADPNAEHVYNVMGPRLRAHLQHYHDAGDMAVVPGLGSSPWLLVMGEYRAFPFTSLKPGQVGGDRGALAQGSMAMWLKATALGLGFQMVSAVGNMTDNEEFCELVGLPAHTYCFDACALGYPETNGSGSAPAEGEPVPSDATAWFE